MITIDVTGRVPIYEQICKSICSEISKGILKENDKIPSARALAKELGINPNTIAKAYAALERDGIIYSVAGRGCFVAEHGGMVGERLTYDFKQKTIEALEAGVDADTLIEIVRQQAKCLEEKNNGEI
ncbi:MAG: GntR family transcriptional regulator [Ruminococcus sp.]|nr:GntR family transcriptional regulator [Ruminococcus sp.]